MKDTPSILFYQLLLLTTAFVAVQCGCDDPFLKWVLNKDEVENASCSQCTEETEEADAYDLKWNEIVRTCKYSTISSTDEVCPDEIHVSWLNLPPFTFKNASNENGRRPFGVFVDVMDSSLNYCCSEKPKMVFDKQPKKSIKEILNQTMSDANNMIMPVNVDKSKKYLGKLHSLPVMVSPADVVLVKKSTFEKSENNKLWQSIQGVFLAILLAVLLSLIAGVGVWALETRNNADDFPRPFAKGTSEGFWWAFVTMTTVGYGDRTPKSLFGRLFGVVWIIFGISLCSIVTAAITSGLMASLGKEDLVKIRGKKVGVLAGSHTIRKAIKSFAMPKAYYDLESMREAVLAEKVEAILVDIYVGLYLLDHSNDQLHLGNILENHHHYGIVFWNHETEENTYINPFPREVHGCLEMLFKYLEMDVQELIDLEGTKNKLKTQEKPGLFSIKNPFFKPLLIILGVLCGSIILFVIVEVLYNLRKKNTDQNKAERTVDQTGEYGLNQLTNMKMSTADEDC